MMLAVLAESALRSLLLGSAVWVALNLFRVRNPHVHMTCWVMVLVASLAMPLLMHWTTVTVTHDALPLPVPETLWSTADVMPLDTPPPSDLGAPVATHAAARAAVDWLAVATIVYACIAGVLLLRLVIGIHLTWRLVRTATPIHEPWTGKWRVRVSDLIGGPVTFGSTILLPLQYLDWDVRKRRVVLAHEGAHVANRDFYILLLASLNRTLFWFSPFAWWQLSRLAELAELISDASALEVVDDRLSYAEILLDLVQRVRRAPAGLQMARACTLRSRVEFILAGSATPARLGWRKRIGTAAAILPVVIISAGSIAYATRPVSTPAIDGAGPQAAAASKAQAVSFYSLGRTSIFTVFREGDDLFGQLSGQRKLRLAVAGNRSYSYPAAAGRITVSVGDGREPTDLVMTENGREMRAARIAELSADLKADTGQLDSYLGSYQLAPGRALTVSRDGDRLYARETGRSKLEVIARGADAFSTDHDEFLVFLRDGAAKVTQVLLQEPLSGARLAPRISDARAKIIEEAFARRVAEVPDRFREQAPQPGSMEAILRGIEDLRRGSPNYDRMRHPLAAKIRSQISELQGIFTRLGAVESIFFRGVGPGGYDFYGVKFANGSAEFRLLLGPDGKAEDVVFRADGNDAPGAILACDRESDMRLRSENTPIHVLFYNATGASIQLYKLDADGKRTAQGTIGEHMTSSILTSVENPWVVADASGKCLEIVLPGQQTRYHTIEGIRGDGQPEQAMSRRRAPLAGSEAMLRQYIEALGRGEPDYDHMTAELATQTRQQLPINQAIVNRLGALRSVSFRGVTNMGSDIYMAHFANGSAEWRIGLVKDGVIGRIALGPQ